MIAVRHPDDAIKIADPDVRRLMNERFTVISEYGPYDPDESGYFVLMEEGDSMADLEAELGFSVLANRFSGKRFGDPDFSPCAEVIEELPSCFDLVYVIGDAGFGVNLFVPKLPGIPPELLAMCQHYAIPAPEPT